MIRDFFRLALRAGGFAVGILLCLCPFLFAQTSLATLRRDVDALQGQSLDKRVAVIESTLALQTTWLQGSTVATGVSVLVTAAGLRRRKREDEGE